MKPTNYFFALTFSLVFSCSYSLFSQPTSEYTSDANTVLLLHLNETTGNIAYDASSYGNHGTINGNAPSEGKFFGGRQFPTNNTDSGIVLPNSSSLNITGPITIEAWIKVDAYEEGGTFTIRHNEYQLLLGSFGAKGYLQFFRHVGNEWHAVGAEEQIPLNEWVHVAGVWDGATARIFINGQQPITATYPPAAYAPAGVPRLANYEGSILQPTTVTLVDEIRISNIARIFSGQDLIAYYPLDGSAIDLSSNNNNGTIIGGVTATTDRFGNPNKAMQFNGIDGYIEVPNSTSLQSPTSAITIAGWVYIDAFPGLEAVGIVEKTNSNQYGQYGLNYQAWSSNVGLYYYHNNGAQGSYAPVTLEFLRWYFVATTYDGTTAIIYLDGVPIASQTVPGPIVPDDNPLTMGLESPGDTEYLQGKLDEIRIYNRALSGLEILELYNPNEGLIAYYPLNGNANDFSGNNNNGTIIGGVDPTTDQFGNPNKAMQFNGIDGYIEVPNSTSLQSPTSAITIAGWVYIDAFPGLEAIGIVKKTNSNNMCGQYGLSYQAWSSNVGLYYDHNNCAQGSYAPVTLEFLMWYFVAVTYDGTTAITYLDGIPISSQNVPGPIVADDNPLTMGLESPGQNEFLQGKLDEIRIYNRALSPEEIAILTDVETDNNVVIVNNFILYQNYPNPFNPVTSIQYSLEERSFVSLKVYDVLGNEISVLVNEEKPSGIYEVNFNAASLSSGIYFYKLKAGSFAEAKKMLLLK